MVELFGRGSTGQLSKLATNNSRNALIYLRSQIYYVPPGDIHFNTDGISMEPEGRPRSSRGARPWPHLYYCLSLSLLAARVPGAESLDGALRLGDGGEGGREGAARAGLGRRCRCGI